MTRKSLWIALGLGGLALAFGTVGQLLPHGDGARDSFASSLLSGLSFISPALAQGNDPPIADAGFDQTLAVSATAQLDGTVSTAE